MSFTTKKSYIAQNIEKGVWKVSAGCNIYVLMLKEPVVIDAGERSQRKKAEFVEHIIDPRFVKKVIFTHLHYDHIGNFDLFPNAEFFASQKAIDSLNENPENTVLSRDMASKFTAKLKPISQLNVPELEIIETPGHTKGSICIYYKEKKILFSGDTVFANKNIGRTDFPTSVPKEMPKSLAKLIQFPFQVLCPGHDYSSTDDS